LMATLLPRISEREWDVVSQLAFQIQNKNTEGAGDELLNILLDPSQNEAGVSVAWNRLSFAARALEFLVPSPKIARRVASLCLDESVLIAAGSLAIDARSSMERRKLGELIASLLACSEENRPVVSDALKSGLEQFANGEDLKLAAIAAEVMVHLPAFNLHTTSPNQAQIYRHWNAISEELVASNLSLIRSFLPGRLAMGQQLLWRGFLTFEEFIGVFGLDVLFRSSSVTLLEGSYAGVAVSLLHHMAYWNLSDSAQRLFTDIGKFLGNVAPPWFSYLESPERIRISNLGTDSMIPGLSGDALFGILCLALSNVEQEGLIENAKENSEYIFFRLYTLLLAMRKSPGDASLREQDDVLSLGEFDTNQLKILQGWADGSISFWRKEPES
jgi:hypothetical protein